MYAAGTGVTKDLTEAAKWMRKAAEQGNAIAQRSLGVMYADGSGVAKDDVEAANWWRKAAEQGYAGAQYQLAICYAQGLGTGQDSVQACKWVSLAAAQGLAEAKSSQEALERGLTPEQLAEAQRLVREWKPRKEAGPKAEK